MPTEETRSLMCTLTEAERLARGSELATILGHEEDLELKKAEYIANHKDSAKVLEVQRKRLARAVNLGAEPRETRCAWVPDFAHKAMVLYRQDTGEQIESRPMTADELQAELPHVGRKKKGDGESA